MCLQEVFVGDHSYDHHCSGACLLCRDTYPNQHVEISVRVYIYRWITTDVSGIPQVCPVQTICLLGHVLFNHVAL